MSVEVGAGLANLIRNTSTKTFPVQRWEWWISMDINANTKKTSLITSMIKTSIFVSQQLGITTSIGAKAKGTGIGEVSGNPWEPSVPLAGAPGKGQNEGLTIGC